MLSFSVLLSDVIEVRIRHAQRYEQHAVYVPLCELNGGCAAQ